MNYLSLIGRKNQLLEEDIIEVNVRGFAAICNCVFKLMTEQRYGQLAAINIAEKLNYIGVLAVEFFVSHNSLFVNELAPRPHNSGHWTLDAASTSQFEQQVRALVGKSLGDPSMTCGAVAMVNLLGDRWTHGDPQFDKVIANSSAHVHLYGKKTARPGRKMGHLTVTGETVDAVAENAVSLRTAITR